jgi:hypothetical protein
LVGVAISFYNLNRQLKDINQDESWAIKNCILFYWLFLPRL